MLLFFFHAGTENEDRTDLRSVLLPSGDLKGTYFPSLYVYAYFIVAKWSVILFFRFFFFFYFLVSFIILLQTMSHFLKWRVLVKLFHHAFYFLFVCLYNLVSHPAVKNDQSVFASQFSLKWLTNSSSRDSDAGSRLSSQDDSHCYGQQSFIGLSLRIASLPFHLFFWGGGMVLLHVGYVGLWSSDCLFVDLLFPRSNQLLYYCSSCLTLDVACDVIFVGQFKLITEMFHITHRALHIGLTTTIQHYNRIMRLDILSTHSYIKKKSQSVAILFLKSNWTLCEVAKEIAPILMMNKQIGLLCVNL